MSFSKLFFYTFFAVSILLSGANCASSQYVQKAQTDTKNLKEGGCLLFRLPSADRKIKYFEAKGWTRQANQERTAVAERNKELMAAFKAEFDFCPVYFFEAKESDLVEAGNIKSVQFLNENLEVDASLKPSGDNFLTATFSDNFLDADGYHGTTEGIIVSDSRFYTLAKPFPRHSPKYFLFFKKSDARMVWKLNKKLDNFYRKNG